MHLYGYVAAIAVFILISCIDVGIPVIQSITAYSRLVKPYARVFKLNTLMQEVSVVYTGIACYYVMLSISIGYRRVFIFILYSSWCENVMLREASVPLMHRHKGNEAIGLSEA